MLSQPKFWLCLPPGLGAVTRLWVTEVWSRDCISYQSSADGGLWVECFSECCFHLRLHKDVVIRQWHANIAIGWPEADHPQWEAIHQQLLSVLLGMLLIRDQTPGHVSAEHIMTHVSSVSPVGNQANAGASVGSLGSSYLHTRPRNPGPLSVITIVTTPRYEWAASLPSIIIHLNHRGRGAHYLGDVTDVSVRSRLSRAHWELLSDRPQQPHLQPVTTTTAAVRARV